MSNDNIKKKLALHVVDPDLARLQQGIETTELLKELINKVAENKPEGRKAASIKIKGNVIKGEPGKTPVVGVDYFTEQDKKEIIEAATPIKGEDYFTESDIEDIVERTKPVFGVDYFTDREIAVIKRELKPVPGEDFPLPNDGYSPQKGVDYFTAAEKKEFIKEISKKIPPAEKVNYDKIISAVSKEIPAPVFPESIVKEEPIESIVARLNKLKGVLDMSVMRSLPYDVLHGNGKGHIRGGTDHFVQLLDAPSSYSGQALKGVRVNAGATGLEFYTVSSGGIWGSITGTLSDQTDLQTALNLKATLASPTFTGTVVLPTDTSIGSVSSTELSYLNGVTSAIQTQIDTNFSTLDTNKLGTANNLSDVSSAATAKSNLGTMSIITQSRDYYSSTGFGATRYGDTLANRATDAEVGHLIPISGVVKNLHVLPTTNSLNGSTVFTLMKNGVAQSVTVTITAGSTTAATDTSNSFTVAVGDRITLRSVAGGSSGQIDWYHSYLIQ
jgi:hypothetical protein